MLASFIIILIIVIILIICMLKDENTDIGSFGLGVMMGIAFLGLLFGICICIFEDSKTDQIKPIDAYHGNTTLEVPYKDSII